MEPLEEDVIIQKSIEYEKQQSQFPEYWIALLQYNNETNFRSKLCNSFLEAKEWIQKETKATNNETEGFMNTYLENPSELRNLIIYSISGYKQAVIAKTDIHGLFFWRLKN